MHEKHSNKPLIITVSVVPELKHYPVDLVHSFTYSRRQLSTQDRHLRTSHFLCLMVPSHNSISTQCLPVYRSHANLHHFSV